MDGFATPLQLDSFLPYRAARLATALSRGLAAQYEARYRISVAEWRVLVHLTQESEISVRDIFTRVDMDRARVTRAVQRLETRGLVSKLVNETDRRLVRLALTDAGRDLAADLSRLATAFEARIMAMLPADTGATLLPLFDAIEEALDGDAASVSEVETSVLVSSN
ncbi:MAG: MarR family winged helix-turn-helix transcriptional regulator [Candidatus Puniceispirillaceae bacterium]|jgi:DNA-binding MarR family transcriptional regulator